MTNEKEEQFHYGGQAVIEGVMMRGPKDFAVAVRRSNGEIVTTRENVESMLGRLKWLNRPFLRGTLALIDAMALGIKALKYSFDIALADIEADERPEQPERSAKSTSINNIAVNSVMVLGLIAGVALFMLVPILITKPLRTIIYVPWQLTAIEGLIKITIFVGYVAAISLMKDIRRVFQYHGAEHKTINAYEAGQELTVEGVLSYKKAHVRCGTSFILVVLVTSILVFMVIADHLPYGSLTDNGLLSYLARWAYKIALLPIVAGLAYEVIRFAGKHKDSHLTKVLVLPGLLMQKITTREPEPEMIEVAIASLKSVLETQSEHEKEAVEPAAK